MIMIGSTGRNVGKTEFACELIRRHIPRIQVTAVKITTIRDGDQVCPHGGQGCGACASLGGRYALTEERDPTLAKDTARMLRAGAQRVLWLRAREEHLAEGVAALLEAIPAGGAVICETNAARGVLEPGLFFVFQPQGEHPVKASARAWLPLADRVVTFTGAGWDLSPDQCHCHQGVWSVTFDATAVMLAGGRSSRMGRDKSLMEIGGQPLIARIAGQLRPLFPEVLVSANDAEKYRFLGLPVIQDATPDQGPLMGILSSLKAASRDRILVLAADIPVADPGFIHELLRLSGQADIVMPVGEDGLSEPLFAVYRKTVIPRAETVLAEGHRRVTALLPGLTVLQPPMPKGWYYNLNTPDDYARFCQETQGSRAD
jgi:molybdopterin-guanine dinucleotide biosynthesis protein A